MRRQSQPWTWLVVAIAGWIQRDQQTAIVCVFGHDGSRLKQLQILDIREIESCFLSLLRGSCEESEVDGDQGPLGRDNL